jgi:hypothetical protein
MSTLTEQAEPAERAEPTEFERRTAGWFPSRWGWDDEAGALNEITPSKVLEAVALVRRGTVHDLAHVLHAGVPAFPGRTLHPLTVGSDVRPGAPAPPAVVVRGRSAKSTSGSAHPW